MKRLRDLDVHEQAVEVRVASAPEGAPPLTVDGQLLQQAQELLRSVDPLPPSPARMRRVRAAIAERSPGGRARKRKALTLSVAFVLLSAALVAAQNLDALRSLVTSAPQETAIGGSKTRRTMGAADSAPRAGDEGVANEEHAQALVPESGSEEQATGEDQKHIARQRAADTELVRQAVKALRRDRDPARAARLLESVYTRESDGVLAEEVMALRVEAALARKNGQARNYAQQYLARYPQGRYRAQVLKAR
jgi:hypothetical protein